MGLNPAVYSENIAKRAKLVSGEAGTKSAKEKNYVLGRIVENLLRSTDFITEENKKDLAYAESIGKNKAFLDRLVLNSKRIESMAEAVKEVMALPDPVGRGNYISRSPNGLKIERIRVPLGVVAMIFESRPNVTIDAAVLCIKSGNAVILRGGKESLHSNLALAKVVRQSLKEGGFPEDTVQMIEQTGHEVVNELLKQNQFIDVVIPRGGESLIRLVSEKSTIPVIKHDKGVCHVFVDESADQKKAENIVINSKCQRPSVCNAAETLLIHKNYPFIKELIHLLLQNKVEVVADDLIRKDFPGLTAASEEDWFAEYLDYKISVRLVDNTEEAVRHINHYGSHHSDAIVSENYQGIQFFLERVDSAAVYANASTRFTDGGEFGLGAEIGISTQKLHVRGPMGLEGLTTEKWVVYGSGQIRE